MKRGDLVGVDVGGTFTDVFVLNLDEGNISVAKVPTTAPDQSVGFLEAVTTGVSGVPQITTIVHGTTCLLYTSPSPRDGLLSRMPSSA